MTYHYVEQMNISNFNCLFGLKNIGITLQASK